MDLLFKEEEYYKTLKNEKPDECKQLDQLIRVQSKQDKYYKQNKHVKP